ncbi:hypothetical protein CEE37_00650 [candidate division LCP-89 bacterium B3_LCP]|uniref:Gingipain domain-containing protein n=1 Tax=candidate division LCP-89 bacterium B3_LCP TaxID=2012998 RepID=A0A532V4W8_UNCL8|nr:MAG: hypothetical protein CEE37_00650 [candidate division LCP-89 bacterium B3_LCP]
MKKHALLSIIASLLLLLPQSGQSEWFPSGANGTSPTCNVISNDASGIRLQLTFPGFESETITVGNRLYKQLSFDGSGLFGELGQPEIPVLRKLVLLPEQKGWNWEITESDYIEISGYTPPPLQEGRIESPEGPVDSPLVFDESSYQDDRWFPDSPVHLDRPVILRDYRIGRLELRPIQYNPARDKLRVYRSLTLQIRFDGVAENPILRPRSNKSRLFSQLVKRIVMNPPDNGLDEGEVLGGYLFITPPNLQSSLETMLVEWKREKGFPCTVKNTNETGTSAYQIKSYIQNIYNTWPVPPDYLILVGDNDYGMPTNTYSGSGNASDLPYVLLEGTDYFPDMLVGRLSVDSSNDLAVICSKIKGYESDPYTQNTDWFTRGLMVYDYNGSLSCKNVKERCRDLMYEDGYVEIVEISYPPYSSGYPYINNEINDGVTFVNYRGYGSYSCWTPPYYTTSNISSLYNGWKLPIITSIVCGGGNFTSTSSDPCFGEGWIRYGSTTNPKGAVGFVGPTSLYTHTRWNNCIDGGIYQGIFSEGIGNFGSAVLRGLMELYFGMPNNQGSGSTNSSVECYFHIYTILGDPGLEMWTGIPSPLVVTHETTLPLGINSFAINIESHDLPVKGALVCVYSSANNVQITGWTDVSGDLLLDLEDALEGTYTVTVTGHNLDTYQGSLTINQQAVALGLEQYVIDDDMSGESSGNGDALVNPGETIELVATLTNTGSSQTATNVTGTVNSSDPYLVITQSSLNGPDASPGATSQLNDDFNLVLSEEAPHSRIIQVSLTTACDQGSWENLINLPVVAPLAEANQYAIQNPSGIIQPGETADVTITLLNSGGVTMSNCIGTLTSPDEKLTVTDGNGAWGQITPGASSENSGDPFTLEAAENCPPGWTVPLELIVSSDVYCDTLIVSFLVGEITDADPAGPDAYGYRCFDSRDVMYQQAPVYDWMEISSVPGQITLSLPDYGYEDDCSVLQNLPFTFRYYGQDYNQITVCSNGWISMGSSQSYISFRNWNIPGALGPPAMIAPFWDDLILSNGSVHYFYDFMNYRVIVEWKNARTLDGYGYNWFQVILNDPAYYPTSTRDGEIIFQYYQFQNYDADENYCTIGIENWQQSDGVKVTYANHYTPGSATLSAGVALKFTTDIDYGITVPDVNVTLIPYGTPIQIPTSGGTFDFNIAVDNNEPSPQTLGIWCDITLPNGSPYGPVLGPVTITLSAGTSVDRDRSQSVPALAPSGDYLYNAYVGSYPDVIWDSDSFDFSKLSSGAGDAVSLWLNTGEEFDGEILSASPPQPEDFRILSTHPNPFNPTTTISFDLPSASLVKLDVFDINGRNVGAGLSRWDAEGETRPYNPGTHQITFDGTDLPSGIYIYRLTAGDFTWTGKMVLMK